MFKNILWGPIISPLYLCFGKVGWPFVCQPFKSNLDLLKSRESSRFQWHNRSWRYLWLGLFYLDGVADTVCDKFILYLPYLILWHLTD